MHARLRSIALVAGVVCALALPTAAMAAGIVGGPGMDTLYGTAGWDSMDGLAGDDKLYGASGNDIMRLGSGADFARGDIGNDTIFSDTVDLQVDVIDCGAGAADVAWVRPEDRTDNCETVNVL